MTRKYFCWKVSLSFRCGCTEQAPIVHRCPPDREGCNSWLTHKRTDKMCDAHRAAGWGLAAAGSLPSSSSSSPSPSSSSPSFSSGLDGSDGLDGSFQQGGTGAGAGVVGGQSLGEGESGPRRRASPVDNGEAGAAAAPGRRVVGYY